jgi:hypothetical protein
MDARRLPGRAVTRLAVLVAAALAAFGATCEDGGTGPDAELIAELATARDRWEAQGYTDYALTLRHDCFCGETHRGPVVVNVRSDQIVARVYQATGEPVPQDPARFFPDVEGLFAFIAQSLSQHPAQIRAEFHPELGYPTEIFVDFAANIADEERGYRVLALDPLR